MRKNYLDGDASICLISYQFFCLFIFISYIYVYFTDKDVITFFQIIILIILYISNIIVQLVSVGFRKFLCIQDIKYILYNNIHNKFTVTIKATAWHTTYSGEDNTPSTRTTFKEQVIFEFNSGCDNTVEIIGNEFIKPHYRYLDLEIAYNFSDNNLFFYNKTTYYMFI